MKKNCVKMVQGNIKSGVLNRRYADITGGEIVSIMPKINALGISRGMANRWKSQRSELMDVILHGIAAKEDLNEKSD